MHRLATTNRILLTREVRSVYYPLISLRRATVGVTGPFIDNCPNTIDPPSTTGHRARHSSRVIIPYEKNLTGSLTLNPTIRLRRRESPIPIPAMVIGPIAVTRPTTRKLHSIAHPTPTRPTRIIPMTHTPILDIALRPPTDQSQAQVHSFTGERWQSFSSRPYR